MKKLIYLTTNPHKVEEANKFFKEKYGFELEIVNPDFEILETQAKTCSEVVAFSAKYEADKLGYFDKQIGVDKFLDLIKNETNRKARLEHCFAYCEPGEDPIVFSSGGTGTIAYEAKGNVGRWHDMFYIPDGETMTLSELRELDYEKEAIYWGDAKDQFAKWYVEKYKDELS